MIALGRALLSFIVAGPLPAAVELEQQSSSAARSRHQAGTSLSTPRCYTCANFNSPPPAGAFGARNSPHRPARLAQIPIAPGIANKP